MAVRVTVEVDLAGRLDTARLRLLARFLEELAEETEHRYREFVGGEE